MVRLFSIAAASAALATFQFSVQAENLNNVEPSVVNQKRDGAFVVEYYTPGCTECTSFEPKWDKLVKDHSSTTTFAKVNCETHNRFCQDMGITRTPTLQSSFNGGEWKQYSGDFSLDTVNKFIQDSHPKRNINGATVELKTSKELKDIIESREPWFVKFYAPWCTHCKHLAPIWEKMSKKLQDKVNVAEVNCEDQKALCQEYKVTGLPTLSYFVHGAALKYTGERKLEKLLDYAIEMSGSPVHNVDNDSQLDDLIKASDVNLIYVRNPKSDYDQLALLEKFAPEFMEHIPFYTTTDSKIAQRFNLKESDLPAAVIVKDGNFHVYNEQDIQNLVPWIHKERYPLVTRILPHNSNRILKGNQVVVLGIASPDDTDSHTKLREMAKLYRDEHSVKEITFALLDGKLWGNFVSRAYGIHSSKMPAIIVLDPKNEVYYDRHANGGSFLFDHPDAVLKSIKALDTLKSISTARSKAMGTLDKVVIFFGEHWILMTGVLFGFFGLLFWLMTKNEPTPLTAEQIREIAKKEVEERKQREANPSATTNTTTAVVPKKPETKSVVEKKLD